MPQQKGFAPILIVLLIAATLVGGGFLVYQKTRTAPIPTQPDQVACTQEAKLCPDGTSVGRSGPNCEFSACPTEPPMQMLGGVERCDLNTDGKCDGADIVLFQKTLGSKRLDINFNSQADADGDGVVTEFDKQILFPQSSATSNP